MLPEMLGQKPLIDEADDLHLAAGLGAFQRLDVTQLFDALTNELCNRKPGDS
jgi:hypothetical protein